MPNPKFIKEGRKLATIREVKEIRDISGADKIQLAIVDGWECVIKKEEVKTGELVIYIEIDSILPERPEFEFLRPRNFRIKTIKLRGQISQGLVLPLSYLKEKKYKLGDDVTEEMGIKKYDPESIKEREIRLPKPKNKLQKWLMKFEWYRNWRKRKIIRTQKPFPGWISKTDETRVQNLVKDFNRAIEEKTKFFVTEKLDGQSFTAYVDDKNFVGICSRNLGVSKTDDSNYAIVFRNYELEKVLIEIKKKFSAKTVVIQGEICGPGIQGNKYKFKELELFVFNLIIDGKIKNYEEMEKELKSKNVKIVPLIEKEFELKSTIREMVDYSKGNSVVNIDQKREGIVIRDYQYNISFKVINPDFLLEEE
jgi:hypothetical protein